ncbi:MAG TPA: hypothetical protein VH594_07875 [Trebonia sp.]
MKRITIVAAVGALTCLAAMPVAASQAATLTPAASAASTFGATGHSPRLAASANGVAGFKPVAPNPAIENAQTPRALTKDKSPGGPNPSAQATGAGAAKVTAGGATKGRGSVTNAFDGLNDLTNDQLFGALTPPDQGLCVGPDHTLKGAPDAVWEVVNEVGQETTKAGAILTGPLNLPTLFQDPNAFSDPRCLFDPSTQSFYFTQISFPAAGPNALEENTVNDVLVINSRGAATYQFDSSMSGQCLGDQPKVGFDNNALIISTDEYCGANQTEIGAQVQVISKSQLVNEAATVNFSVSAPLSLAGDPIVGLDPAINTGTPTAYLVNSVPFLADGSNNPVGNTLGLWTLGNTASVTSGTGTPTLTSKVLRSEPYAFPVPAPSTGDGSVTMFNGFPITSEAALNPDDSRLSGPVNVTPGPGGSVNLWTALDAAVVPSSGTAVRDGAAWFEINTRSGSVINQGFVAASGNASLLYPAMQASSGGKPAMVFTITSPTVNPSAAFTLIGNPAITIVGAGAGPHTSFADAPPFNSPRWGDYSQAATDPQTGDIYMATEYIPPAAEADGFDNWGTFVFGVKP